MTIPTVPHSSRPPRVAKEARSPAARPLALSALATVGYLVWFWIVFALGYWVTDLFGLDPGQGSGSTLIHEGPLAVLATVLYALVAAVPSWVGVWLGMEARRAGARAGAALVIALNGVIGLGVFVLALQL